MENITANETNYQDNKASEKKRQLVKLGIVGLILAICVIGWYLYLTRNQIYVEKSQVLATEINLGAENGGKLEQVFVSPGDEVKENQKVAQVGNEVVKAENPGVVIGVNDNLGKVFSPGETVVTMIEPSDLRVVAQVEEDKGLKDIRVGERAFFTVDAFPGNKYWGIVDEVSPTYRQGDVVFNISSQRQLNEFNVKVRFDVDQYPELKNGMSAKAWILKD